MFDSKSNTDFFAVGKAAAENLMDDFTKLLGKFSQDESLIDKICRFAIAGYSEKHRAYHNLGHIGALLFQAENLKENIRDRESVGLAIWFHDIIYQPKSSRNEIKSAEAAVEKINAGASLVQVYTGLIYDGPELVAKSVRAIAKK